MKKLLVILLILAMLVPMGTVVHAEEAVETKPFYLLQWTTFKSELSNVYNMAYLWTYPAVEGELMKVSYPYKKTTDIHEVAQNLKNYFDGRPEGTRYINFDPVIIAFRGLAEDVVYVEKGVKAVQDWLNAFLPVYQSIGGELDGLVVDAEFEDLYATYIHSRYAVSDPFIYDKIVKNPQYETLIRPKLAERGFRFYGEITEYTPEIYGIHPNAGDEYAQSRSIWDAVLRSYVNDAVTRACSPVWEYYPDALVTDYQSKNTKAWLKEPGVSSIGGNYFTAGNSNCENTYSVVPHINIFIDPKTQAPAYRTFPAYNSAVFENKTFNYFLYDINIFKNSYLASDNGNVSWWIAHYLYNTANPNSVSMTPYYVETLMHMGMLNPEIFMGYIIQQEIEKEEDYECALQIVNDVLAELTELVGAADRKPIGVMPTWNSSFVLSGMYAGGKNVWRLTPDTSEVSLEAFKVADSDPTFSVNGQTVTFPQGKIIEGKEITKLGSCGYWIETPENVTPVISRVANYHSEYPAFREDYEQYAPGTEYTYKNALPVATWEVKKSGASSAVVQADPANGDNQVLALKGTYGLKNVSMPKNITAGDSYAKNQAWEVCVTVPSDMATDAELILLNAANEKKKSNDGGFKIAGGKVYYSQNGEYVELAGVTVAGDTKYRLKREVDFTNPAALTSDYYVYDGAGQLLGSAMDIPMAALELPVHNISLSCANVAGNPVLLDDYKLYPTGVTTDFELYGAQLGMPITDVGTAQEGDVAYRLSWMNATQSEKLYSVVAAYYEGDTLVAEKVIKEIKLPADFDGVETGVVENATEGQKVLVYLRDDTPPAPEVPVDTQQQNKSTTMLILIVAAAVVVVGAVVVIVIFGKKTPKVKKMPVAEETAAEEDTTDTQEE